MKKKRSTRLTVNLSDIFIGIICFVGMFYCLFLFWKDINVSFTKNNETPIAVIYFKKNTAQRKLIDSNIWERLKNSTPIYNGDKIRTAAMSEAYSIFTDCSKIDLHENSLIQVFSSKNKSSVDFLSGSISILSVNDSNVTGLEVQTGNKVLNFTDNTSAVISISAKDITKAIVTVTSGSVLMEEKPVTVKQDDDFLSTYLPDFTSVGPKINLPVTTIGSGNSFVYELVNINPEVQEQINKTIINPSEIHKDFSVEMPTSSYTVIFSNDKAQYIPFFWSNYSDIKVVFATDSAFTNIIQTKKLVSKTGRSSINFDFAKNEESVFWYAYPLSSVEDFEKEKNEITQINKLPHGVIFVQSKEDVKLLEAMELVFEKESVVEMEKTVSENEAKALDSILYMIEIENKAAENEISEPVVVEEVIEETVEEVIEEIVEPVVEEPLVPEKEIKIVEVTEVAKPVETPVKETKQTVVPVEPKVEVPVEPPVVKIVEPALVSAMPVLILPENNTVYNEDYFMESPQINLQWNALDDAQEYFLVLKDSSGNTILSKTLSDNFFEIKDDDLALLDNGEYTWSITAGTVVDEKSYSSKTAARNFSLVIGEIDSSEVDTKDLMR